MSACKFRISISLAQLDWILACPDCPPDLAKQLKVHKLKVSEGLVSPSYVIKPKEKKILPIDQQYRMACQYLAKDLDIPEELMPAYDEFRYLNDLMSAEEVTAYEQREGF